MRGGGRAEGFALTDGMTLRPRVGIAGPDRCWWVWLQERKTPCMAEVANWFLKARRAGGLLCRSRSPGPLKVTRCKCVAGCREVSGATSSMSWTDQLAVCLSVGFSNEKCRSGVRVLELEFEVVLRMRVQHQQPFPVAATTKLVLYRNKNPQLVLRVCSRGFPDRIALWKYLC